MLYDIDLPKIIRRYVPVWFRWPTNLQMGYVLLSRLGVIHLDFLAKRDEVIAEYRYNGLKHSLEAAMNDHFDPVLRRIFITIDDQLAALYYQEPFEPPVEYFQDEGGMAAYHYLDESQLNVVIQYDHEFIIWVPIALSADENNILALVEVYRYAGRRPKILYI
jgi:hypothetical protein